MTTTDTMDTIATVNQSLKMISAGAEYVRITAPNSRQAQNLQNIKDDIRAKGINTPLIADIHFTPNAAEIAAQIVEKVRINPGNYADKKKFKFKEYTDKEYSMEIDRIHEKFSPLVKLCKKYGTAMRIGTNHGSLSDRIMNRYGDTPLGMVESALEFARICEIHKYHNLVFSMKASNPIVVVQAYRLLVKKMIDEGMNYPLHLGVTEAGDGEDGRIKSALGIGTLLYEGLGDTIRVSLTEPPENEIPVANSLVKRYSDYKINNQKKIKVSDSHFELRKSKIINNIGGSNVPRVVSDLSFDTNIGRNTLNNLGYSYMEKEDKWGIGDFACDYIYIGKNNLDFKIPGTLSVIQNYSIWKKFMSKQHFPMVSIKDLKLKKILSKIIFVKIDSNDIDHINVDTFSDYDNLVLISTSKNKLDIMYQKKLFQKLNILKIKFPVILSRKFSKKDKNLNIQLNSTIDIGSLLIEGYGDGIFIENFENKNINFINSTCFGILQASRRRISKTEYISCPSCGRTLFDLEETTAMIRSKTGHLKGVKIGIMGCIVNGPGEMADADYGYVGTGVGKISLYRGQKMVKSSIDSKHATKALIDLIKEDGNWVEPKK